MVISMLKIRRPLGRLIFNMGIAIPGKTVFLIETAPWMFSYKRAYNNLEWCMEISLYQSMIEKVKTSPLEKYDTKILG